MDLISKSICCMVRLTCSRRDIWIIPGFNPDSSAMYSEIDMILAGREIYCMDLISGFIYYMEH